MNTKEQNKDSIELAQGNFTTVLSQENKRIILGTLPTTEWMVYIQDPESYCRQLGYDWV